MNSQNQILADLYALSSKVLQYENKSLQERAKKLIPLEKITLQTEQAQRVIQTEIKKKQLAKENETHVAELFVFYLMKWFKEEFFTWVDKLDCELCNGPTVSKAQTYHPLSRERIEIFYCVECCVETRFQRFNTISDLLDSRRGRCGEWANCFTFLCRVLGYQARYIHDLTDHAWTEIYSPSQQRWIHCDPCEVKMDSPLLYEKGWGKKLTYVLAASCEEVQDVTWRYTGDFTSTLQRRHLVSEVELIRTILEINKTRQASLSPPRRHWLLQQSVAELAQFLTPPSGQDSDGSGSEYGGRISGSLQWRMERGETGPGLNSQEGYTFQILDTDFVNNTFTLEYCPARDAYFKNKPFNSNPNRGQEDLPSQFLTSWSKGVFSRDNVFRKVESDWKMVYLCRTENSAENSSSAGRIKWKLNLSGLSKPVARVEVYVRCALYENGHLTWTVASDKQEETKLLNGQEKEDTLVKLTSLSFSASQYITIDCVLAGGRGSLAWQHAQLFRSSSDPRRIASAACPFLIRVTV
uniref:Peptide-N(4)-(N-acetyl-beta-glucosaminyl)asparagine amidase n=1 Tax=Cacopsylla melanoneura TaxID=428564 RepID=A0A8D9A6F6_9HEMI